MPGRTRGAGGRGACAARPDRVADRLGRVRCVRPDLGVPVPALRSDDLRPGQEELAAEMTSSMLCAEAGVDTDAIFANSAGYIGSWLETIKADPKMVIGAAAAAQKAADLVLE